MKINENLEPILRKWYKEINFPTEYDEAFETYLATVKVDESATPETYEEADGPQNFLTYLYFCEQLQQRYREKGISETILYDTFQEFYRWTIYRSKLAGKLNFDACFWVVLTMKLRLFRLGRLNFCIGTEPYGVPSHGLEKGDPIIEVHIPREPNLLREDCLSSLSQACEFFATYFPDHKWKAFTCHSWLLDSELKGLLSETSNILQFQELFDVVLEHESAETLHYVFGHGVTKDNIAEQKCKTSLAQKVRDRVLNGTTFHESYGIIKPDYLT